MDKSGLYFGMDKSSLYFVSNIAV